MSVPKPAQSLIAATAVLLALPGASADQKKPRLELRVMPLLGPPSTEFLFVADLKGGLDSSEDLYCLTLEWQWGKDDASVQEPECPPFQPGATRIERRFSQSRAFSDEGPRNVTLILRKDGKDRLKASASFRVTWEKKPRTGSFRTPPR